MGTKKMETSDSDRTLSSWIYLIFSIFPSDSYMLLAWPSTPVTSGDSPANLTLTSKGEDLSTKKKFRVRRWGQFKLGVCIFHFYKFLCARNVTGLYLNYNILELLIAVLICVIQVRKGKIKRRIYIYLELWKIFLSHICVKLFLSSLNWKSPALSFICPIFCRGLNLQFKSSSRKL